MMTMKRDLPLCLFGLCLLTVFLASGCGLLSSPNQPPAQSSPPSQRTQAGSSDIAAAEAELKTLQQKAADSKKKADQAEARFAEAEQKYEPLRKEADTLSQQSVQSGKASSVKDPKLDDPKQSPITQPARKKADDASKDLDSAKEAKEAATKDYRDAQDKVVKANERLEELRNQGAGGVTTTLLLYVLPPFLIGLLLAVLSYVFWRRLNELEERTAKHLGSLSQRQSELNQAVETLNRNVIKLGEAVAGVRFSLTESGARDNQTAGRTAGEASSTDEPKIIVPQTEEIEEITPDFPTSVSDYFARQHSYITAVRPDRIKGMLVKDADGHLMLVQGTGDYRGDLLAIPRPPRFKTVQDYNNHFEKYYYCNKPGSGEVVINSPAIVTQVDGGWELDIKGSLEIR